MHKVNADLSKREIEKISLKKEENGNYTLFISSYRLSYSDGKQFRYGSAYSIGLSKEQAEMLKKEVNNVIKEQD